MTVLAICVATAALGIVVGPASAQLPSSATVLPGRMDKMVVDSATGHVFVSLYDTSKIAVLDFDGNLLDTITGEAGARGLALVGSHLYVAASNAGSIDDIDTTTLTRTRTVASGLVGTSDIVYAAGALWVVTTATTSASLVRVAPSDGAQTSYSTVLGSAYFTGLVADPADNNTIFVYDPGISGVTIKKIDVSANPPQLKSTSSTGVNDIANVNDIAVSPDGTRMVPAGGSPYQFDEVSTSSLALTGVVYPAAPYPSAVTMTAGNGGLFAGGLDGIYGPDVVIFRLGDPSATVADHDFGSTAQTTKPGGLAFSPDGSRLFAVSGSYGPNPDTFNVLTIPDETDGTTPTTAYPTTTTTTYPTTTTTTPPGLGRITVTPASVPFGNQRVGTYGASRTVFVNNTGNAPVTLRSMLLTGANRLDFFGATDCFPRGAPRSLAAGAQCRAVLYFGPSKPGALHAALQVSDNVSPSPHSVVLSGTGTEGYLLAGAHGQVGEFGDAVFHGDTTGIRLSSPMISLATTPNGAGYWLLGRDGGIFSYGNARFYGSTGAMRLNQPIVALFPTHAGKGYWLVGSDGGIFTFGDARFYGSTGAIKLNRPIDGMASTPDGRGYWLVASDGGIFAFGNAGFYGSAGGMRLTAPVVQMTPTRSGHGYWLLTADGNLYPFGDARSFGTATGHTIVGMAPTPDGNGYWEVSRTGEIFAFGDARSFGDLRGRGIDDVVGIAATAPPLPPGVGASAAPAGSAARAAGVTSSDGAGSLSAADAVAAVGRPIPRG